MVLRIDVGIWPGTGNFGREHVRQTAGSLSQQREQTKSWHSGQKR